MYKVSITYEVELPSTITIGADEVDLAHLSKDAIGTRAHNALRQVFVGWVIRNGLISSNLGDVPEVSFTNGAVVNAIPSKVSIKEVV